MVRAPYPARIAAGLIVTAVEETRRLPARVITFPMTALSQTLQVGMRFQQNIAELAIKGDSALDFIFDRPDEQPEWARFDEDEDAAPVVELPAPRRTPVRAAPKLEPAPPTTPTPATQTPTKRPAKAAAPTTGTPTTADAPTTEAPASTGRFALYSSAPADLVTGDTPADNSTTTSDDAAEIVGLLDYDNLTLAQLRAKIRTVGLSELEDLANHEKQTRNRAPFVTMLDNRITAALKKKQSAT